MGNSTVQGFSLTPDEEKFFVRFLRRRALSWSAVVSALVGGLTASVLTCSFAPAPSAPSSEAAQVLEVPGLAPPLADEQARSELAALRKQLEALRARPAPSAVAIPTSAPDDSRMLELRRSLEAQKRELQTIATSVTELQRRKNSDSAPAAPDAATDADLEPLRSRVLTVEQRVRTLEQTLNAPR